MQVKQVKKDYRVTNPVLLYQLADAGLLHLYICGIGKDHEGKRVWYFERNEDVKAIISKFNPKNWADDYTQEDYRIS